MIEAGTILQERYLIEKQIGAGGMGAVYLAVDQRFESYVAIKETFYKDDELGDAFEREARLLNSLHHPNLPHVSDYFTEGGGHFLVMQFIEGEDLFEILKRGGSFPQENVLRWTNSLLDALDYLHSQEPPVIHRDIKPQNLKITTRGDIILLDFGLAKLNSDDTQAQLSVFGYSRKYSPLEQIQGTGTDARSDIFALGATVYHLLTGKPPIDVLARASAIVAGNPDPLVPVNEINEEIPAAVSNILNTALALNAAARFVTAKAAQHALVNALNSESNENTEVLPFQESIAVPNEVGIANGVISSAETENFPALEAFAAEAASNSLQTANINEFGAVEVALPNAQVLPVSEVFPQSTLVIEEATKVSAPRPSQSRFGLASLLVLLCSVGLAAGYFITKANSSNESNQAPLTESATTSNSNIEQSESAADSAPPEILDEPVSEKPEQTKTTQIKPEPIVEKRETIAKRETEDETPAPIEETERIKTVPEKSQPSRPAARQATRRSEPARNDETRPRVIEAPVPDIESIFTGRPSAERNEKLRSQAQRKQQRQQMSDEELREYRRQRREERRRRANRIPFPF
jgi:serine/threonine protein kinase